MTNRAALWVGWVRCDARLRASREGAHRRSVRVAVCGLRDVTPRVGADADGAMTGVPISAASGHPLGTWTHRASWTAARRDVLGGRVGSPRTPYGTRSTHRRARGSAARVHGDRGLSGRPADVERCRGPTRGGRLDSPAVSSVSVLAMRSPVPGRGARPGATEVRRRPCGSRTRD